MLALWCCRAPAEPAPHGHSTAEFETMAADLKASLAKKPDDADNWVLLGRTLASLQRWPEAKDAFTKALALAPNDPALHAQFGEVLTLAANGTVTDAASAEFKRAPDDPRSRFYRAVAIAQGGDTAQALALLRALANEAPPDAAWRRLVLDEIQTLSGPAPAQDAAPSSIDSVRDYLATLDKPAAAPAAGPYIEALAQAVKRRPNDAAGWLDLARAYRAAGQAGRAADTLRQANQAVPANEDLLLAYADLQADGIKGEDIPAPFLDVMRQVNAIDADQPDALWYLGVDAAHRGDTHRARKLWQHLAGELPAGSGERAAVQLRLDALR